MLGFCRILRKKNQCSRQLQNECCKLPAQPNPYSAHSCARGEKCFSSAFMSGYSVRLANCSMMNILSEKRNFFHVVKPESLTWVGLVSWLVHGCLPFMLCTGMTLLQSPTRPGRLWPPKYAHIILEIWYLYSKTQLRIHTLY